MFLKKGEFQKFIDYDLNRKYKALKLDWDSGKRDITATLQNTDLNNTTLWQTKVTDNLFQAMGTSAIALLMPPVEYITTSWIPKNIVWTPEFDADQKVIGAKGTIDSFEGAHL